LPRFGAGRLARDAKRSGRQNGSLRHFESVVMTYAGEPPDQAVTLWRDERRAGLLMLAYFMLSLALPPEAGYVYIGHSTASGAPPSSRDFAWIVTAFFAWRVARGGRISRMLLIIGTGSVYLGAALQVAPDFTLLTFGKLALCAAQFGLLLSPAVFERTRPADRPERALRTRVMPPLPVLLLGALAGSAATLLGLYRISDPAALAVCAKAAAPASCTMVAGGLPLGWLTSAQGATAVDWAALVRDWVEFAVIGASVCYACWLGTWARGNPIRHRYPAPAARRGRPPVPVTVCTLTLLLALAGSTAAAVGIFSRTAAHDATIVYLAARQPVTVTLPPGGYGVFGPCIDRYGCIEVSPSQLSVQLAGKKVSPVTYNRDQIYGRLDIRTKGGQMFLRTLSFSVPGAAGKAERAQFVLNTRPPAPVLITPSESAAGRPHDWVLAARVSAAVLSGSLAALAWLLTRRPKYDGRHDAG
jgi:hypothetical protein